MRKTYLRFQDVNAPLELVASEALLETLGKILPRCPASVSVDAPSHPPFFRIEASDDKPGRYLSHNLLEGHSRRRLDGVNAICDMIAALSVALPESDPRVLCLHAAAVEIGGRLILFPNARRAGKSTLTAALARHGARVFSDDFLPVRYDRDGRLVGRANGIAPRVRLPLPEGLNAELAAWIDDQSGPGNAQYKYLSEVDLAHAGDTAPLGAIVLLDRQEAGLVVMSSLPPEAAMDTLLKQNFTRDRHSGEILTLMTRLLETLPPLRVTYSDADDAAQAILAEFADWPDDAPQHPEPEKPDLGKADIAAEVGLEFNPDTRYVQRCGAAISQLGDTLYLADPDGSGIHRLNDVSAAIWALLEEPMQAEEVVSVLAGAFPDTDRATIETDTLSFLKKLARAALIAPSV